MMEDVLKFTETPWIDESIEEYEYHEYDPITVTNLHNCGDIRLRIESQDVFTHPSESYLLVEGSLTKADGTPYANADEVASTNNAIMHLFSRIEYHLSNQLIESLSHTGQATIMFGLLKYSDDFSKAQGLNQLWYKDTATNAANADNNGFAARHAYLIQSPTVKCKFSFTIPLKHIFGFCEDYDKIVYGLKNSITVVGKTNDDAIFRAAATFSCLLVPYFPDIKPFSINKSLSFYFV